MKRRQLLFVLFIIMLLTACGRPSEEQVRSQMEKYLYEKYGEEFVVDRIGMRSANEQKFYQARIYPKSIIGTEKEEDDYYYASASIDVNSFGKLDKETGDSFDIIQFNDGIENYLLPKAKELFGDRIRIKSDSKYKKNKNGTFYWAFQNDFLEAKKIVETDENYRMELTIYIYIFNRIDSEEEKEKRREQIFEFIQYLKVEGLFEYLEMGVIFIDERVLAPSYSNYGYELKYGEKVKEEVEDKSVYMPSRKLREEMSKLLQIEIDKMTEEELLKSMNVVKKGDLSYRGINKENAQMSSYIYSELILEYKYPTALSKGILIRKKYIENKEIEIEKELEYVYY